MARTGIKDVDLKIPESNEASLKQTLAIAHYNLAVEYEHSQMHEKAMGAYKNSLNYASIS